MLSYAPLWDTMKKKEVSTYALIQSGIDKRTIFNLKHGKNITLITAEKICVILDCTIADIVEFI